jgi:hypothetical protein
MNVFNIHWRHCAGAAALSAACALSHAATLRVSGPLTDEIQVPRPYTSTLEFYKALGATRLESAAFTLQWATDATAALERESEPPALANTAASGADRRAFALSVSDDAESRAALEPSLWRFARYVHALQRGDHFETLHSHLELHQFHGGRDDEIAAVPLPGAVWLFVMGGLGLVGSRMTRVSGEREGVSSSRRNPGPHPAGVLPA